MHRGEDASITFFLDQRRPKSVDLEFYAPLATTYQFYWNLDLYAYDRSGDRKAHQVGSVTTTGPGWQRIHLDVPAALLRGGLNKLGFRTGAFQSVAFCPEGVTDAACVALAVVDEPEEGAEVVVAPAPIVMRPTGLTAAHFAVVSLFAGPLVFNY